MKTFKSKLVLPTLLAGSMFAAVQANAAPMLSFDDDNALQDGVISYDGVGGALIGTGIDFHSIIGLGTDFNDGVTLDCVSCELSFTTGDLLSSTGGNYTFAAGGSFTVTGTANDGTSDVASGILLEGVFDKDVILTTFGNTSILAAFGSDEKNEDLLSYYFDTPLPQDFEFANTEISLAQFVLNADGSFVSTVTNADLDNTEVPAPEPSAAALLGLGIVGLALGRRRAARRK